jgi:RsiW-degrading membrane proteinase PrsW (M82 family)
MHEEIGRDLESEPSVLEGPSRWVFAGMLVAAVGGGWLAVTIAILPGLGIESGLWVLLFFLAPFYEEALKPLGVYYVFLRWPHIAISRIQIAVLAAVGGLTFALIESWLYVDGHPEQGDGYVLFRFTAPVVMHVFASFVIGLGLKPGIFMRPWRRNRISSDSRDAYLTAVGIHMAYNIAVVLLAVAGVRELVERSS